jgi:hypothetical protein
MGYDPGVDVGLRGVAAAPLAACTTSLSPRDWADQGTDQGIPWYGAPAEILASSLMTTPGRRQ